MQESQTDSLLIEGNDNCHITESSRAVSSEQQFPDSTMSDVNTLLIEPLTKFVKDSAYLVKKCTKPDHKGTYLPHLLLHLSTAIAI